MNLKSLKQTIKLTTVIAICLIAMPILIAAPKGVAVTAGKAYEIVEVRPAVDGKMTEFFFTDDNGTKHSILDLTKGKYTFLNFWGTWCPPCRAEIPSIIELQSELKKDLIVIGVAMERDEATAMTKVNEFATSKNINYVNFVGKQELIKKLTASYKGISAVPTTFLVNKSNDIFTKIVGSQSKEKFKENLDNLMR